MATIDDLERRVAALEAAQTARGDNAIARIEREVKALPHAAAAVVAEAEERLVEKIESMGAQIARLQTETLRLDARIGASEGRIIDVVNDRFDAVMAALDKMQNPPR
jgi:chromosome segregation ATPase